MELVMMANQSSPVRNIFSFSVVSESMVDDLVLPSGLIAAQVDFGGGNVLIFAGLRSSALAFSPGLISYA